MKGFIALISVILISAVLIALVVMVSAAGFYSRFNVLDYENKKVSVSLAEACAETALVNLAKNPTNYPSSIPPAGILTTVDLAAGKTCRICLVSLSSPYSIITRAVYNNAYTNLTVTGTLGASNFNVSSWDEQASYAGSCLLP